jgi:Cof subfamily protein (haloacid dehalogenase superfamily)
VTSARSLRPPKLVACDLDGTVVRSDGTISPRTRAALGLVEDSGATLVFVTGRPPRWMHAVAEQTDHHGLAICANGALVYDLHTEDVVAEFPLDSATLREAIELLRGKIPDGYFAVEYGTEFAREHGYRVRWDPDAPEISVVDVERLYDRPAAKLLLRHEQRQADELLAAAKDVLGDLAEVTHSSPSGHGLLEISALGVSKASTLARLCERRGIDAADVMAFGDMPNDLPMLAWAGTAYAMANAHPDVLAAVDHHTARNDDDGVALVLEQVFRASGRPRRAASPRRRGPG